MDIGETEEVHEIEPADVPNREGGDVIPDDLEPAETEEAEPEKVPA